MKDDLISRQAAIDKMMDLYNEDVELYGVPIPEGFDGHRAVEAIKEIPPAEPERKQGKWIIACSVCGTESENKDPFCSYCGAKIENEAVI